METVLAIIFIVFGVLQIILFFKVWGMTNDVSFIKKVLYSNNLKIKANVLALKGELTEAKKAMDESFLSELTKYDGSKSFYHFYDEIAAEYEELYKSIGVEPFDFEELKEKSFEILG